MATLNTSEIGWVICRTDAGNWDEQRMNFADYSQVRYDLYTHAQVADEGWIPWSTEAAATVSHDAYEKLGLDVSWGDVHESGDTIEQGGATNDYMVAPGTIQRFTLRFAGAAITGYAEWGTEEPELYYHHPLTGHACENVGRCMSGWSEQDCVSQLEWSQLIAAHAADEDFVENLIAKAPDHFDYDYATTIEQGGAVKSSA